MSALPFLAVLLLISCTSATRDPISLSGIWSNNQVVLDLSDPQVLAAGPVMLGLWAWDANVLWQPVGEGRPGSLLPPVSLPGPETGGTLVHDLARPYRPNEHGGLSSATATIEVLVPAGRAVRLRIGAFPGAQRVWVNGVIVHERGVLSLDPSTYRPGGSGDEVLLQPIEGRLSIVVNLLTNNPLVKHRELNRLWSIATASEESPPSNERVWRAFQVAILVLVAAVFLLIGSQFRKSSGLVEFGVFLLVCFLKLVFNVEEPRTLLALLGLETDQTVLLFLNHGLNLIPFVLFLWFLHQRFPKQISMTLVLRSALLCAVLELWELTPFVALVFGWAETYETIMTSGWSLILNIAVVLSVLLIFERLYQIDRSRLPLGRVLFGAGVVLGLIIMVPVILSLFVFVPFSYYLGSGLFLFLILISWELIRLELLGARELREGLLRRSSELTSLAHYFPEHWANRLGRNRVEDVVPGDTRLTEACVVQLTCSAAWEHWLPKAQNLASKRTGVFVEARERRAIWLFDSRPENALAFALEIQAVLNTGQPLGFVLAAAKAVVELSVFEASGFWIRRVEQLPLERLTELSTLGECCQASIVLDVALKDGLVVGGWRKHRELSPDGQTIELFEGDIGPESTSKLETADLFEKALFQAANQDFVQAAGSLLEVLRVSPLDQGARHYLELWQVSLPRPR